MKLRFLQSRHVLFACLAVIASVGLAQALSFFASIAASLWASMPTLSAYIIADAHVLAAVTSAGFLAQLVDGALGMGYGLTSSTVLVAAGLSPMTASACVHAAQLGTTLASGVAHYRCGTVDWPTAWRLALPGTAGAILGAGVLSSMDVKAAKTLAGLLLFTVGAYLFARFLCASAKTSATGSTPDEARPPPVALLAPVGAIGGFVDVAGGGGWGPVATTSLLAEGRLKPHKVIGTVSLSEFFVTVAAVAGLAAAAAARAAADAAGAPPTAAAVVGSGSGSDDGHSSVRVDLTGALLIGGLLAAPIAPLFVTRLQPRLLGVIVGGFICLTNARTLLKAAGAAGSTTSASLAGMAVLWLGASAHVARSQPAIVDGVE